MFWTSASTLARVFDAFWEHSEKIRTNTKMLPFRDQTARQSADRQQISEEELGPVILSLLASS